MVGDEGGLAAGFLGVEAVVTDGLLALGWDVEQGGGDEIGSFEDLKVSLGVVVAFGAADDGLGGGVPGDCVKRLRLTRFSLSRRGVSGWRCRGRGRVFRHRCRCGSRCVSMRGGRRAFWD